MARAGDLEISIERSAHGSATVVCVDGDLDMATAPQLEEALERADVSKRIVIDLSGCTFLDSPAVRALVVTAARRKPAGGKLALVTRDPGILRVLEIASVDVLLPVHETIELASVTPES